MLGVAHRYSTLFLFHNNGTLSDLNNRSFHLQLCSTLVFGFSALKALQNKT